MGAALSPGLAPRPHGRSPHVASGHRRAASPAGRRLAVLPGAGTPDSVTPSSAAAQGPAGVCRFQTKQWTWALWSRAGGAAGQPCPCL